MKIGKVIFLRQKLGLGEGKNCCLIVFKNNVCATRTPDNSLDAEPIVYVEVSLQEE